MEKIIKNIFVALIFLPTMFACNREEVPFFSTADEIYFSSGMTSYVFNDHGGVKLDTLQIMVRLLGRQADQDRDFMASVAKDVIDTTDSKASKITTATAEHFRILGGKIPANSSTGMLNVEVKYTEEMDDSVFIAYLQLDQGENFPSKHFYVSDNSFKMNITNKLVEPENWFALQVRFGVGPYSTSWFEFIIGVAGSKIPYHYLADYDPVYKKKYPMSYMEASVRLEEVRKALKEYNREHPDKKLTHSDGVKKGEIVIF